MTVEATSKRRVVEMSELGEKKTMEATSSLVAEYVTVHSL